MTNEQALRKANAIQKVTDAQASGDYTLAQFWGWVVADIILEIVRTSPPLTDEELHDGSGWSIDKNRDSWLDRRAPYPENL